MPTEDLMAKFGVKTGGGFDIVNGKVVNAGEGNGQFNTQDDAIAAGGTLGGGRRKRHNKSHKGNSWLDHVKYTMKEKKNKGKSFKQILKLAKKSYKKSQSQSGGKGRKGKSARKGQHGGSGGKVAGVGESASPYV
jgi:hypothetical protein